MNDDNPAKVLPNGYVYSQKGLDYLASQSNNNTITCPSTGKDRKESNLFRYKYLAFTLYKHIVECKCKSYVLYVIIYICF